MLALSSLQGYIFVRGYEQCIVVTNLEPNVGQIRCIRQDRNVTSLQSLLGELFQPSHVAGEASLISCGGGIAVLTGRGVG
jgi:hypothetical protein